MTTNTLRLRRTTFEQLQPLEDFADHTVHQSQEWVDFISQTQAAQPVFARIIRGDQAVGRFSGLIIKKAGVRILGSPFPGWTTSYLGFNLHPDVSRKDAVLALEKFAFHELKCQHFELMDRNLSVRDVKEMGFNYYIQRGYEVDLSAPEGEIFKAMHPSCRRAIRRAAKLKLIIEQSDGHGFVEDYYPQLQDVFAKQGLIPTYPRGRVETLIENLMSSGRLLLLRAITAEGHCAATSIFPAMNDTMFFWGGASWREYQQNRPNEAMMWFAMRYWKARGITRFDMGGGGEYKRKYGGAEIAIPWLRKSKYPVLERARNLASKAVGLKQRAQSVFT